MWGDVQIADAGIVGQHDGERRWGATGPELLIEHVGDGGRTDRTSPEDLGERGVERGRAEAIEQVEQTPRFAEKRMAPLGERLDEARGVRAQTAEPITPAQLVSGPVHGRECGDVRRVFDDLAVIVRADMPRELRHPVDDPDRVFVGDEGERSADGLVRDRVVVAVEADVGRLAGCDRALELARKRMLWERQQSGPLLGERLVDDPSCRIARHGTPVRRVGDPRGELSIQIGDVGKPPHPPRMRKRGESALTLGNYHSTFS